MYEFGGKTMPRSEAVAKTVRRIMDALNPRLEARARRDAVQRLSDIRRRQIDSAWVFLHEGEAVGNGTKPPHGDVWDRNYNPVPYPEAVPSDYAAEHLYEGTEIGHLYGIVPFDENGDRTHAHAWKLAGWNLVKTGSESRKRRK